MTRPARSTAGPCFTAGKAVGIAGCSQPHHRGHARVPVEFRPAVGFVARVVAGVLQRFAGTVSGLMLGFVCRLRCERSVQEFPPAVGLALQG